MKNDKASRPLLRLIIPHVPYPNVFSHIVMPPLGVIYLASSVKEAGVWDVEIIDEANWRHGVSRHDLNHNPLADHSALQKRRPADAVGFYGGLSSTIPRLFKLAEFHKSLGLTTLAGGAHVDALPEEALNENIDIVAHGEGEETINEILDAISGNRDFDTITGISFTGSGGTVQFTGNREPICDLDDLPVPDFSLMVELKRPVRIAPFERSRGCNFKCEFCIVSDRFGPSRVASPERVVRELEMRVDEGFRKFFCVDDNFIQGRKDTLKLLELITDLKNRKKVKLNFTVQLRSSVGRDESIMLALRRADVKLLCIGLESPIREELECMSKNQTPVQIENDVRSLRSHGFMIHGMFIFGYPLEDLGALAKFTIRERAEKYIDFVKRTAIDTIQVLKPVPIPGSRLAKRLKEQGRILPLSKVGWDKYDGSFLTFLPDGGISASEIQKQANRIMRSFYHPFSFLKFPLLVFSTPVEILRMGFKKAGEFAKDPAFHTQAAISDGVERASAFKAGFAEAGREIARKWRNASFRTLGSVVVTNAMKAGHHREFVRKLREWQMSVRLKKEGEPGKA